MYVDVGVVLPEGSKGLRRYQFIAYDEAMEFCRLCEARGVMVVAVEPVTFYDALGAFNNLEAFITHTRLRRQA
jgi:hypothetical protein